MSYVKLATIYHESPPTPGVYNALYNVEAISDSWTGNAIPTTGNATYSGYSFGIALGTLTTTSAFSLTADFATGNVSGSLTGFQFFDRNTGSSVATPSGATGLSLNFAAPITGDTFTSSAVAGTAIQSGRVQGQFAGPNAEEVGGVYQAMGSSLTIVGGFLGKSSTPTPTPTTILTGPSATIAALQPGSLFGPPSKSLISSAIGDVSITTTANLQSPSVMTPGIQTWASAVFQAFSVADQRTPPVSFPGVVDTSWSVSTPVAGGVDRTDLDVLSFAALNMSYVRLATVYSETTPAGATYYDQYVASAISNSWTRQAMPTTGSATYSGSSFGIAGAVPTGSGASYATTSAFSLSADFATGNVTGSLTGFQFFDRNTGASVATPSGATGLSLTFSAPISGDRFSTQSVSGTGITQGQVQGRFAGPHAEEVGGAYGAVGPSVIIAGGFLGKH